MTHKAEQVSHTDKIGIGLAKSRQIVTHGLIDRVIQAKQKCKPGLNFTILRLELLRDIPEMTHHARRHVKPGNAGL